ncbi:MAG TPA: D-alanyl-D-alanine carboxypeptidase [Pyrinomonadaceae bacterium]|nr:D-alanyl-D-alanine carboxypeptidase [Pyrinomonadaceae bacterium]
MSSRKATYVLLAVGTVVVLTLSFVPYTLTKLSDAGRRLVSTVSARPEGAGAQPAPPAPPRTPEFDVAAWYMSHEEEPEKQGVLVETLDGRRLLASHNADTQFNPASLVKLATTLAVLRKLGPDYRFETQVYVTGTPDPSGRLQGRLHVATNDPLFGDVTAAAVARELRARGIRDADEGVTVSPNFSFNFSESIEESVERLKKALKATASANGSKGAKEEKAKQERSQAEEKKRERSDRKETGKKPAANSNSNKQARRGNRNDESARGEENRNARREGSGKNGEAGADGSEFVAEPPAEAPLFVVESYPLREVLLYMNVHSSNFVAERIGALVGGPEGVRQFLIDEVKIPAAEVTLSTASGLEINRMTPRGILAVLRALNEEVGRRGLQLQDIMPIASDEGTLRQRFKGSPLESSAVGKTGTLVHDDGGMAGLAGVIYTRNAGPILFAVLAQGSEVWQNRQVTDQLLTEVITLQDTPQPIPSDTPRKILQHDQVTVRSSSQP